MIIWRNPTDFALTNDVPVSHSTVLCAYCGPTHIETMLVDFMLTDDVATYY